MEGREASRVQESVVDHLVVVGLLCLLWLVVIGSGVNKIFNHIENLYFHFSF